MNENNIPAPVDSADEDEINLLDLLQTLAENARLLIFGPLIVGLAALGFTFTITPTFTATTRIMLPQQQQSSASAALAQLGALAGMAGAASGIKNPADMYIALLKSNTVADQLIGRFELLDVYEAEYREDARKRLAAATQASAGKDGLITISVDDSDPKRAADMANTYVTELSALTSTFALTEAQQRRQFFEKELSKAKENLVRAEVALGGAGIGENVLKFNPEAMGAGLASLKAQVVAKEVQLSSMRGYLTENSPDFRQAQQELTALRNQLAKTEHSRPSGGNAEYINRFRDFKYNEVLFEQLAKQYELAKIDESREGAVIQVVDPAEPPERKSKPKKGLIAILTTLATGFALILFVFVRGALRNARQDPESAAKLAAVRAGFMRVFKP